MIEIVAATIAPPVIILAAAYPLRPQGGRRRLHAVPAAEILARLADEADSGLIPASTFGDMSHPPAFTVQTRQLWVAP